jgi:lysyl-tRNA synthetase class 2
MPDLTELEKNRQQKADRLREAGMEPYPNRAERTHTSAQARRAFEEAPSDATVSATLAGRLRSVRSMGKAVFAHIEDGDGQIQLLLKSDRIGPEKLEHFKDWFDLGDILQAGGTLFRTRTGEITLQVESLKMLAKAITPLPASKETVADGVRVVHSAFDNPEARYRQRYADLAVNADVRQVFVTRARMISARRPSPSSPIIISCTRTCTCGSRSSCTSNGCSSAASSGSTKSAATSATRAYRSSTIRNSRSSSSTWRMPTTGGSWS